MSAFALQPRRGRRVTQLEGRLARELATVQSRLSAATRAALPDTGEPLTPSEGKRLLARLAAVAQSSRGTATAARRAARTAAQLVALGAQDAAEELEEQMGRASFADPPLVDEEDVRTYHQVAAQMVGTLAADHYDQLRRVVEDGLREGATDREIGRSIARLDIGLSRAHANTWARTESTRFYTLGRVQQAEVAGDYVWGYEYVVIEDTHTTDICRGFIGKRVSKEAANRFPPFHYNCRTTMKSVLRQDLTGQPEQPPGTELDPDAKPAAGFGADPRRT